MERIIETEHVNRVFAVSSGEFCALKDINVSIPEGAFAILKGRSGSRKNYLDEYYRCIGLSYFRKSKNCRK